MKSHFVLVTSVLLCLAFCLAQPGNAQQFTDLGATLNIPATDGAAWGDFDGDGYADLYIGAMWQTHAPLLLRNNQDGTFTDVTVAMGISTAFSEDDGVAWADFDNDGDLDLSISHGNAPITLYRNDGDTFVDVGGQVGFTMPNGGRTISWGDYDRDGWLDVFVCDILNQRSHLFHSNGDGTFTEVTVEAGMGTPETEASAAMASVWADFNNDGWLDLFVSRRRVVGASPPRLYINNHDGTFTESAADAGIGAISENGRGIGIADYDNDGFIDIFMACGHARPNWLFHNNGDGTFTDMIVPSGMADFYTATMGAAWADYDNDCFADLFIGAGGNGWYPLLYHSNADGTFTEVAQSEGMNISHIHSVACWADMDHDGRMDVFSGSSNDIYSCLFKNVGPAGNYLRVRVLTDRDGDATDIDTAEDRDAIGARVEVNLDNDPDFPLGSTIVRVIDGGSSYLGQNEPIANFGLGSSSLVAVRAIFVDGAIVVQTNVPANQEIVLRDTAQTFGSVSGVVTDASSGAPISGVIVTCGPLSAVTGPDGFYIIPEICAGMSHMFTALKPGYYPSSVPGVAVVEGQDTPLDFSLQQMSGAIAGTVRDSWTWELLAGATVVCEDRTTTTGSDGSYLFSDIPAGTNYTVTASAPGYNPGTVTNVVVEGGQTTTVDFYLDPLPGTIEGTVMHWKSERPVCGATVFLNDWLSTTTGADGRYSFTDLAPGTGYWLTAMAPHFVPTTVYDVTVAPDQTTTVDIPLSHTMQDVP